MAVSANLALDVWFVLGLGWGIAGSAWASVAFEVALVRHDAVLVEADTNAGMLQPVPGQKWGQYGPLGGENPIGFTPNGVSDMLDPVAPFIANPGTVNSDGSPNKPNVGIGFTGGTGGAKGATLTFMCGGEEKAFASAKPVLEKMGKKIVHCGGAGAGRRRNRPMSWRMPIPQIHAATSPRPAASTSDRSAFLSDFTVMSMARSR